MQQYYGDMPENLKPMLKRCESECEKARLAWKLNDFDNISYVLLLPGSDARLNGMIEAAFIAKLGERRGAVLAGTEAHDLLTCYSLYAFTDKLIVGSFDLPSGRKLRNLLDCGIATEDELINDVILGAMEQARTN